jgi:hypothetical protein
MSDAIELLNDIEKHYGSLNNIPECVVKYFDYLSSMIVNATKVSRLSILAELEREIEARMKEGQRRASIGDGRLSQIALIEAREDENILSLIRSKKGGGK